MALGYKITKIKFGFCMITAIAMILEKSTYYMKRGKLISVDSHGSDDCNND